MNESEALKRLEQIEARARQEDLRPELERLAAENGLEVDEIVAEAHRIRAATSGMSRPEQMAWHARDLASSTSLTEDEALAEVRGGIAW